VYLALSVDGHDSSPPKPRGEAVRYETRIEGDHDRHRMLLSDALETHDPGPVPGPPSGCVDSMLDGLTFTGLASYEAEPGEMIAMVHSSDTGIANAYVFDRQ